jgi:hypothetical protein
MNDIISSIPEKYRVYVLALILCAPYLTRAYHALAMGGGVKGIWSAIWFGTNQPKSDNGKIAIKVAGTVGLILLCFGLLTALTGCTATGPAAGYQTVSTSDSTAATALKAWGDYVKKNNPPIEQQQAVKDAFNKFQFSELVALDAVTVWISVAQQTNSPAADEAAIRAAQLAQAANNAFADLLGLIQKFGVKL